LSALEFALQRSIVDHHVPSILLNSLESFSASTKLVQRLIFHLLSILLVSPLALMIFVVAVNQLMIIQLGFADEFLLAEFARKFQRLLSIMNEFYVLLQIIFRAVWFSATKS
jgi:hypothetical protein